MVSITVGSGRVKSYWSLEHLINIKHCSLSLNKRVISSQQTLPFSFTLFCSLSILEIKLTFTISVHFQALHVPLSNLSLFNHLFSPFLPCRHYAPQPSPPSAMFTVTRPRADPIHFHLRSLIPRPRPLRAVFTRSVTRPSVTP